MVNNVHSCEIVWHWNSNIIDHYLDNAQLYKYDFTEVVKQRNVFVGRILSNQG